MKLGGTEWKGPGPWVGLGSWAPFLARASAMSFPLLLLWALTQTKLMPWCCLMELIVSMHSITVRDVT